MERFERVQPEVISVGYHHDGIPVSVASADHYGHGVWWVSRVKVTKGQRGLGVGSSLLRSLVELVFENGGRELRVSPGGYESNSERLEAFYRRAGFTEIAGFTETLALKVGSAREGF